MARDTLTRFSVRVLAIVAVMQIAGCFSIMSSWGCAPHYISSDIQPAPAVDSIRVANLDLDSAFADFFAMQRLRQADHETLPDQETASCLYGIVRGDTVHVAMLRPARVLMAVADSVRFQRCPRLRPEYFGELLYLGMQHPHLKNAPCWWSQTDNNSFYLDEEALIDLLTCYEGTVARTKPVKR